MSKRVLVAMSGGVDSSVAAVLLKEQGYEVVGATMKIWPKEYCGKRKEKACCSSQDTEDARKVCDSIGARHYLLNFEKIFTDKVINYFISEYLSGRTPNPCIICNEKIKFGALLKKAEELGCDFISTGHHAIIDNSGLKESRDKKKDQSYVLFSIKKESLQKILFPIGNLTKEEVKKKAEERGLSVHNKQESQEICFIPDNDYVSFIKKRKGVESRQGDIISFEGKVLGTHEGFWNFTIGQRRGLGIAHKKPLYVIDIDSERNRIIVGESEEVKRKKFIVKDINWFCEEADIFKAEVKIRYNHKKSEAEIKKLSGNKAEIKFKESQNAITPGQAAVFYNKEYVIGGGWIEKNN